MRNPTQKKHKQQTNEEPYSTASIGDKVIRSSCYSLMIEWNHSSNTQYHIDGLVESIKTTSMEDVSQQ